jgi:uncharacterized protein (TIGR03086 family)
VDHHRHLRSAVDLAVSAVCDTPVERYGDSTPCAVWTVADLINHVALGFEVARRHGAREPLDLSWAADRPAPVLDGRPHAQWAAACAGAGAAVVAAWEPPEAWAGEAPMGEVHLPAALLGAMMTGEFAVHAWDLATALGRPFEVDDGLAAVAHDAMSTIATMGRDLGWVGPAVHAPAGASTFDRALAIAGRDRAAVR